MGEIGTGITGTGILTGTETWTGTWTWTGTCRLSIVNLSGTT